MKKRILLLLSVVLLFVGCATRFDGTHETARFNTIKEALDGAAQLRESSFSRKDMDSFLSGVDGDYHPTYYKEQGRWFEDAAAQRIKKFSCKVAEVVKQDGEYVHALLEESYVYGGEEYSCSYPVVFRVEDDGGYNATLCGYDFESLENEYAVFYHVESNAELVAELAAESVGEIARVYDAFGYTPQQKLIINIYPGQKHMIWSVKPSLPDWVGGWAESEESVKMCYFGVYYTDEYITTLAHEACHMVVSSLSNNNTCYWLHEGLAGLLEGQEPSINEYDKAVLQFNDTTGELMDFRQLQYEDYEALEDSFVVSGYYASCKVMAYVLYDEYGMEGILRLLEHLAGEGKAEVGYSSEKIKQMSDANMAAMEKVFGTTEQQLSDKYDRMVAEILGGASI